jgi:hypothetical protein
MLTLVPKNNNFTFDGNHYLQINGITMRTKMAPSYANIARAVRGSHIFIPPLPEGGILFYLCPSFRPSNIFFVAFFSVTVDGRNLIFGHKRHIGIPYCG